MNNDKNVQSGVYNKGEIELEKIINSIKAIPTIKQAGSIHTFTGIVRNSSIKGKSVISMKIDAYDELASKSIMDICERMKKIKGIIDIKIIHLKGEFDLSDDLVYVVVASAHREEGFDVIKKAVELYKKEVAVWKREDFENGTSEWIH